MTEEEEPPKLKPQKFLVVGLITSEDFQKCRYAITKLYKSFPKEYDAPDIRPMLDVEWNEFILKQERRLGNGLWSIKNNVVVFQDGQFLGDYEDFFDLIWQKRRFTFTEDWYELASKHLMEYLEEKMENFRQLAYLTIAINNEVIGTLLFQLYNDIVPLASENFLRRCSMREPYGYLGTPIHRIVKNSWIQCGGHHLKSQLMPCENYVVPHNRRGVLSMCNNGPHIDNSTQFFVTLEKAPWMDYKYVGFGQLLQGDNVLKAISDVPTYYQAPTRDITIVKCGEFKTRFQADSSYILFSPSEIIQWKETEPQTNILSYLIEQHEMMYSEDQQLPFSSCKPRGTMGSCDSIFSKSRLKEGTYSLKTDLKSYGPLAHLPDYGIDSDEDYEDYTLCDSSFSLLRYKHKLYDDDISPRSSDMTI